MNSERTDFVIEGVATEIDSESDSGPSSSTTSAQSRGGTTTAQAYSTVQEEKIMSSHEGATSKTNMMYRHPSDKVLGGVCGGLADYIGWDPSLVRILWVIATFVSSGGGFLAYLALWLLLPVGTMSSGQQRPPTLELNERNLSRAAVVLIGLGGLWLLANIGILPELMGIFWFMFGTFFWPLLLIGIGFLLLNSNTKRELRSNLDSFTTRFRSGVRNKMSNRNGVTDGLKQFRMHMPLKRSHSDRILMGVCGGIGRKLGIDANLVRLIWAAISIGSIGAGVIFYIALGLLLPEENVHSESTMSAEPQDVQVIDGTVKSTT